MFGTLPFILSGSISNFRDAFFESMSGFTTTGATILKDIESLPHGILFWRSLTQWLGGIGIIFISLSVFPVLKSINIQLAATEFSGHSTDKIHPRIKESAKRLIAIYFFITLAEVILLALEACRYSMQSVTPSLPFPREDFLHITMELQSSHHHILW